MAITTVRARLGETWTALEYNPATGRWEGVLLPGRTSAYQPGGYYGVEVEAANDLYGSYLKLSFHKKDVTELLKSLQGFYSEGLLRRVEGIIF